MIKIIYDAWKLDEELVNRIKAKLMEKIDAKPSKNFIIAGKIQPVLKTK